MEVDVQDHAAFLIEPALDIGKAGEIVNLPFYPDVTYMNTASAQEKTKIERMFGAVAPRYDFLNALLSGGRDAPWRNFLTRKVAAQEPKPRRLLDLATGSGEVLRALR
jgi:hypothetical protein